MGDSVTLLNYGHQFMRSLHAVDSRSQNKTLCQCYLHMVLENN